MSDNEEPSAASAGSVEPVAWAALREDGDIAWIGYTPEAAADGACGRQIVPLYRHPQPTLTDAERFVLREVMDAYAENDDDIACGQIAAVIFDLLERAK